MRSINRSLRKRRQMLANRERAAIARRWDRERVLDERMEKYLEEALQDYEGPVEVARVPWWRRWFLGE